MYSGSEQREKKRKKNGDTNTDKLISLPRANAPLVWHRCSLSPSLCRHLQRCSSRYFWPRTKTPLAWLQDLQRASACRASSWVLLIYWHFAQ